MYKDIRARFEQKFKKTEGCWQWRASCAGHGYGQIKLPRQRRQIYAHRLSYELYIGPIPEGKQVLHRCDNPGCVNPAHLFVGSQMDNMQDAKAKDRHLRGERNARCKLTEKQVGEIKIALKVGLTQKRVALAFGISQIEVSRIKTGKRWSHVI